MFTTKMKDLIYNKAFVTTKGVPENLGNNRQNLNVKAVEAMVIYLNKNPEYSATHRNTFYLV